MTSEQKPKTVQQITDLELADQLQQRYEQMFRLQGEIALLDGEKKRRMTIEKQKSENQPTKKQESNDG